MAKLLFRLGLLAARRAKTVIAAWLALLALAAASFLAFGGNLTDQITLPDLETTEVADRLAEELPDAGGDSASAVLRTEDGSAFSEAQEQEVAALVDELEERDAVAEVTDPFAAESDMAEGRDELAEGRDELESGADELESARAEVDEGRDELDAVQEQLDAAVAEAEAGGYYDAAAPELETQQQELDAAQEELDEALVEIEDAEEELADGEAELDRGEAMLELTEELALVSEDEDVAVMMVSLSDSFANMGLEELSAVDEQLTSVSIDGVEILPSSELSQEMPHLFSVAEVIGLMVAALVLLIMLGTFVGAGLPLLNALVGVGIGVAGAMSLSGAVEMMSVTPILGLMLGLAVGIDYALFILHRHRRQLKSGMGVRDSIGLAVGTAGNAVVFAGATVVIALLALNTTGLGFLGLMGTVAAACVVIAVLMAVTMTPPCSRWWGEDPQPAGAARGERRRFCRCPART
ncbi:MMPL family transporter [Nesterenkonia pannonica]|uniref:MMPL family transporter n=1 Tax=Nesterenkonia pannonica TaxID=1548602 RepID=UPI002164A751|nr:MMPL family transporter [Nesterenkonia pannonica]